MCTWWTMAILLVSMGTSGFYHCSLAMLPIFFFFLSITIFSNMHVDKLNRVLYKIWPLFHQATLQALKVYNLSDPLFHSPHHGQAHVWKLVCILTFLECIKISLIEISPLFCLDSNQTNCIWLHSVNPLY